MVCLVFYFLLMMCKPHILFALWCSAYWRLIYLMNSKKKIFIHLQLCEKILYLVPCLSFYLGLHCTDLVQVFYYPINCAANSCSLQSTEKIALITDGKWTKVPRVPCSRLSLCIIHVHFVFIFVLCTSDENKGEWNQNFLFHFSSVLNKLKLWPFYSDLFLALF